jgi:hypothetical protein
LSAGFDRKNILLYRVSPGSSMTQQNQPPVEFGDRDAYGVFDISGDGRFLVFSRTMNPTGQIWILQAVKGPF